MKKTNKIKVEQICKHKTQKNYKSKTNVTSLSSNFEITTAQTRKPNVFEALKKPAKQHQVCW